ncbi:transposase [Candidatus Woesearchaeota archaeon]|nr:transposase [Candidatus Woesearchaeota archaeon]
MDVIHSTLKNFSFVKDINGIFEGTEGYELTKKGVIRAVEKPFCPCCGGRCIRNGWDGLTRKELVSIKVGKFYCPHCDASIKKDISFWEKFIVSWEETLSGLFLRLADRDVALRAISTIMDFIRPMSKDSVLRRVFNAITRLVIPKFKGKYQIVHYDEQHPQKGRQQHYRLTLICALTGNVIADELFDDKNSSSVKSFLEKHLDTHKRTVIITDDCPWYPNVFKEIWGDKVVHQLCILHLNKLVVKDCGRVKTLQEMYDTYLLLGIFFDRSKEQQFLQMLIEEEKTIDDSRRDEWLKTARKSFNKFVRGLEKMRRRQGENHKLYNLDEAGKNLQKLQTQKWLLPKPLQNRLDYIQNHWQQFANFYNIKDCPHTNNTIENYFSSSLKTHRKKQFRTEKGLKNKLKLSRFKRNLSFPKPTRAFLEWGKIFWILDHR